MEFHLFSSDKLHFEKYVHRTFMNGVVVFYTGFYLPALSALLVFSIILLLRKNNVFTKLQYLQKMVNVLGSITPGEVKINHSIVKISRSSNHFCVSAKR